MNPLDSRTNSFNSSHGKGGRRALSRKVVYLLTHFVKREREHGAMIQQFRQKTLYFPGLRAT